MRIDPIPARRPYLSPAARDNIAAVAQEILAEERGLGDVSVFGPEVHCGIGDGPAVLFGDASEIALLSELGGARHDYRLGWLADSGDAVVIGCHPCEAFEAYQRSVLDQPGIRYLHMNAPKRRLEQPAPILCLRDRHCFDAIAELARSSGGLTVVAHIVTGTIWALAARLRQEAGVPIFVAGPPPRLGRATNDKLWFGATVRRLLGNTATPEKRAAHSLSALTRHVSDLLPKWQKLVVKVPDSAGGLGQFVLVTEPLRRLGVRGLYDFLNSKLLEYAPHRRFPVAVEVWDANVVASPSVQVWIPLSSQGTPVIEGVYEQLLASDNLTFRGATTATLPPAIDAALAEGAMILSMAFQALGYFGRCSFDAVVTGPDPARGSIHWIECHGGWGGVSIPMSLLNRLCHGQPPPPNVILQEHDIRFRPMAFSEALARLSDRLDTETAGRRVILLSPEPFESGRGMRLLATGGSGDDALARARQALDVFED